MPELGQLENVETNRDHNLYSGQGLEKEEEEEEEEEEKIWPSFMHELVNYGMERGCHGFVMPSDDRGGRQGAPWGHKLCRNFKYPSLLSTCSENGDEES